ncbi:MAG: alkaline phosphatase family protein [bacterium]
MLSSGKRNETRVFVIGLDGVPHSFLVEKVKRGELPCIASLFEEGTLRRMTTSIPPVSSVAWTTFATGVNPGRHRIFGFMDRRPSPLEVFIPTARHRAAPTLWRILSGAGKKVCVLNVPVTYPPEPVNGFLVSGFLSPDVEKAAYPPELAAELKKCGYVVDVDTLKVRESRDAFLDDLFASLSARLRATITLMNSSRWDFFITHVMETDRLNHFFWEPMENGDPAHGKRAHEFYAAVDGFVGEVRANVPKDATTIVLSDHGFCTVRKEVDVNFLLRSAGMLHVKDESTESAPRIGPSSTAYSLFPGRVFINQKGRERDGAVEPGQPTENAVAAITELLGGLRDPDTGEPVVREVRRRESLYSGPFVAEAAEIVALPNRGYDLKARFDGNSLARKDFLLGTHTHDDAFLFVSGRDIAKSAPDIMDAAPSILRLFGVPRTGMEGNAIFS